MSFDLGGMLQQYLGGNRPISPDQAQTDFQQLADTAPPPTLAAGVTHALRSDQTPPFPQMVAHMFSNADPHQRAGMLNQLLGTLGPGVLNSLAGGLGNLGGLIRSQNNEQPPQITPEQAAQIPPHEVEQAAAGAVQHNPGVVDTMGNFYAQHPTLVKSLGAAALAVALGHIAQNIERH
jgi:hypothetical protein